MDVFIRYKLKGELFCAKALVTTYDIRAYSCLAQTNSVVRATIYTFVLFRLSSSDDRAVKTSPLV